LPGEAYCCSACEFLDDLEHGGTLKPAPSKSNKWDYLDHSPFVDEIRNVSSEGHIHKYRIFIQGLNCSSCTHLLEKLPRIDDRVLRSELLFLEGELSLDVEPDIRPSEIAQQIEYLGYTPRFLTKAESGGEVQNSELNQLLKKIGVAGFSFGNIMLLAIARYGGLDGSLGHLFSFVEILLFLPLLFYSATPFYKGSFQSLKQKTIHLDLVISFSLISSFAFSVLSFFIWKSEMYLDSLAAFTFLILIGRWMIKKAEKGAKDNLSEGLFSPNQPVRVDEDGRTLVIPLRDLHESQVLQIQPGEIIPADGLLVSARALVDTSFVNGEGAPRYYEKNQKIQCGMKALGSAIHIKVTLRPEETTLFQALKESEKLSLSKSENLKRLNQVGKSILYGAVLLAILALPVYVLVLNLSFQEAWSRILSLLVVTCPCALAFGGPLSYALALKESRKKGLLISSADVFDRLQTIQNLVFDKTGTLTSGNLKLVRTEPADIPIWHRATMLGLESESYHPVAFALREAFGSQVKKPLNLMDVTEVTGKKVFGLLDGEIYSLQKMNSENEEFNEVGFFKGSELCAKLYFEDEVRPEAGEVLSTLREKFKIYISSGDKNSRVKALGNVLQLNPRHLMGDQSPMDKLKFVKSHSHSLMLGDGFNDAAALGAAQVGVAIQGPLQQSLKNADVCFLNPGLRPLFDLFDVAHKLNRSLKRNFSFTIAYNVITGVLALIGIVNPLIAAILMPLSSIFVLSQAKRGFA